MAEQRTYLELSEADGGSHKFYEVTVAGSSVTTRYGRIGDDGQSKTVKYKSPAEAAAEAQKAISGKMRKGYEAAVMGARAKRSVGQRRTTSAVAAKGTTKAPVLWRFETRNFALGIFIDDDLCWVGNQKGEVYAVGHDGQVARRFKLPDGVMCLVRDEDWLYCGCNDGNVYDLTRKVPFVAYEISEDLSIYWIDIHAGSLAVSDADGGVTVLDHDCDLLWQKKSPGDSGWMVRCDADGVYHGYDEGITAYDWSAGKKLWSQKVKGCIMFGWQEATTLYAGTTDDEVLAFTKKGKALRGYKCDTSVYSCAAAGDGKYVFAGDSSSSIYCFSQDGTRLWKLDTTCGSALSMQFFKDRLYIVTSSGTLACVDVSEAAIEAARQGTVPKTKVVEQGTGKAASVGDALEAASASADGVLVECYSEGGRVRVRPKSPGFKSLNVQFPRNIRTAGATYLVDGLRETDGGFYRVVGQIRTTTGTSAKTVAKALAKASSKTESKTAAKKVSKAATKTATKKVAKAASKTASKKVAKAATKKVAKKATKKASKR
jgi:predicted DNA-binding WGR domain protein